MSPIEEDEGEYDSGSNKDSENINIIEDKLNNDDKDNEINEDTMSKKQARGACPNGRRRNQGEV